MYNWIDFYLYQSNKAIKCAAPPTGFFDKVLEILLKNSSSTLSPNLLFNAGPISGSFKSFFAICAWSLGFSSFDGETEVIILRNLNWAYSDNEATHSLPSDDEIYFNKPFLKNSSRIMKPIIFLICNSLGYPWFWNVSLKELSFIINWKNLPYAAWVLNQYIITQDQVEVELMDQLELLGFQL